MKTAIRKGGLIIALLLLVSSGVGAQTPDATEVTMVADTPAPIVTPCPSEAAQPSHLHQAVPSPLQGMVPTRERHHGRLVFRPRSNMSRIHHRGLVVAHGVSHGELRSAEQSAEAYANRRLYVAERYADQASVRAIRASWRNTNIALRRYSDKVLLPFAGRTERHLHTLDVASAASKKAIQVLRYRDGFHGQAIDRAYTGAINAKWWAMLAIIIALVALVVAAAAYRRP